MNHRRRGVVLVAIGSSFVLWWCSGRPATRAPEPAVASPAPSPRERARAPATPATPTPPQRAEPVEPVECELADARGVTLEVVIDEVDPDSLEPIASHETRARDGWFQFIPRHAAGLGRVRTNRHRPRPVAWLDGACLDLVDLDPLPMRTVRGRAVGVVETGAVSLHATCGPGAVTRANTGSLPVSSEFELALPLDEVCSVRVVRVFGGASLVGDAVPLPGSLDPLDLELEVPAVPEPGIAWEPSATGLRVTGIERDSLAARAGLRLWDVIESANGRPARGLELDELASGAWSLEVARGGETLILSLGEDP